MKPAMVLAALALCVTAGCTSQTRTDSQTVTQTSGVRSSASGTDYVGDGTQTLPRISYPNGANIKWSCTGCSKFSLTGSGSTSVTGKGPINSQLFSTQALSGAGKLPPGAYTLKVHSDGHWTVSISPQ